MGRPRLSFSLTYLILDVVQHSIINSDVFTFDLIGSGKKGKAGRAGRENSEGMEKRLWGEEREGSGGGGRRKKIVRVGEGKVVRWRGGERKTSFGKQKNDKSALHI